MSPELARAVAVSGIVLTVGMLGISVWTARRPVPVRTSFDIARLVLSLGAVVAVVAITGVGTPIPLAAGALLAGAALGIAQGNALKITIRDGRAIAQRATVGVIIWGAGMVTAQVAGVASRSGVLTLGQTVAYFSVGLTAATLAARGRKISATRAAAIVGAAGAGVVLVVLAVSAITPPRAGAQATGPLTDQDVCGLIPVYLPEQGFATPDFGLGQGLVASCQRTVSFAPDDLLNALVSVYESPEAATAFFDLQAGTFEREFGPGQTGQIAGATSLYWSDPRPDRIRSETIARVGRFFVHTRGSSVNIDTIGFAQELIDIVIPFVASPDPVATTEQTPATDTLTPEAPGEEDLPFPWTYEGTFTSRNTYTTSAGTEQTITIDNENSFVVSLHDDGSAEGLIEFGSRTVTINCTAERFGELSEGQTDPTTFALTGSHGDGIVNIVAPNGDTIVGAYDANGIELAYQLAGTFLLCDGEGTGDGTLSTTVDWDMGADRTSPPAGEMAPLTGPDTTQPDSTSGTTEGPVTTAGTSAVTSEPDAADDDLAVGDGEVTADEALGASITVLVTAVLIGILDIGDVSRILETGQVPEWVAEAVGTEVPDSPPSSFGDGVGWWDPSGAATTTGGSSPGGTSATGAPAGSGLPGPTAATGPAAPGPVRTTTIYVSGQTAEDVLQGGPGSSMPIPEDQQWGENVSVEGQPPVREDHYGTSGTVRSIGPVVEGPDGEISIAVEVDVPGGTGTGQGADTGFIEAGRTDGQPGSVRRWTDPTTGAEMEQGFDANGNPEGPPQVVPAGPENTIETIEEGRVASRGTIDPSTGDVTITNIGPDGTSSQTVRGDDVLDVSHTDDAGIERRTIETAGGDRTEIATHPDGHIEEQTTNSDGSWTVAQERDGVRDEHTRNADGTIMNRTINRNDGTSSVERIDDANGIIETAERQPGRTITATKTSDFTSTVTENDDGSRVDRIEYGPDDWQETRTDPGGNIVREERSPAGHETFERDSDGGNSRRVRTDNGGRVETTTQRTDPDGAITRRTERDEFIEEEVTRGGVISTTTRDHGRETHRVDQANGDWTESTERAGVSGVRSHVEQTGVTTDRRTRFDGTWTEEIRRPNSVSTIDGDEGGWTRRVSEGGKTRIEETRNHDGSVMRSTTQPDGAVHRETIGSSATADLIDANPQVQRVLGAHESNDLSNFMRDRAATSVDITPPAEEDVLGRFGSHQLSAEPPHATSEGVRLPVEYDLPSALGVDLDAGVGHVDLTVNNGRLEIDVDLDRARDAVARFVPASADPQSPNALTSGQVLDALDEYSSKLQNQLDEINAEFAGQGRRLTGISITDSGDIRIEAERLP